MKKKTRKLTKKEIKQFESKGLRYFFSVSRDGVPIHTCIMCEGDIGGIPHNIAIWYWKELARNYVYEICPDCQSKYTLEQIEDKLMVTAATKPRIKSKAPEGAVYNFIFGKAEKEDQAA